jgi:23S rRNA pseudouridine1911/1915/1917 synthase
MLEITVNEDCAGQRLDLFLSEHLGSRTAAQRAISDGRVSVDGEYRQKRWRVSIGEMVRVERSAPSQPQKTEENVEIPTAYSDEHVVVVDKPVGIVSHPAPGHGSGTLSQMVEAAYPTKEVGLVHRLDRDTSGLLMVALDDDSLRTMRDRLQRREVSREYLALVVGHPKTAEGTVDAAIGRDRHSRTRISIRTDTPREAVTHFEVLETFADAALLRVRLETGRTHQIRVHLSEIGLPVAGDPVYGRPGLWGLRRQFLHAARLGFQHPSTDEWIDLESPLPEDLEIALERVRRAEKP